jgi:hypothetical protein
MPIFVQARDPPGVLHQKCLFSPFYFIVFLYNKRPFPPTGICGERPLVQERNLSYVA